MRVRRYILILIIAVFCCLADVTVEAGNGFRLRGSKDPAAASGEWRLPFPALLCQA